MISIRIRLFAIQRELAGTREVPVELPDGSTIEDAWTALVTRFAVLGPGRPSVRFARNGAYADPSTALADGDEVAMIPPEILESRDQLQRRPLPLQRFDELGTPALIFRCSSGYPCGGLLSLQHRFEFGGGARWLGTLSRWGWSVESGRRCAGCCETGRLGKTMLDPKVH